MKISKRIAKRRREKNIWKQDQPKWKSNIHPRKKPTFQNIDQILLRFEEKKNQKRPIAKVMKLFYRRLIKQQIQKFSPEIRKKLHKYLYESQTLSFLQQN